MNSTAIWPLFLLLVALSFPVQGWAAPDYVTGWPKQVPVEKPDPVLGDKPFWEHWVYGEAFARRFKGFPVEKADPDLKNGLQAIVLRIFKRNLWEGLNSSYPQQYACEIDVYFDSSLRIPLSTKKRDPSKRYSTVAPPSYSRLEPYNEKDRLAMAQSQPATTYQERSPVVFSTPLDGRFATFGLREYRHNLVPFISVAVLVQGFAQGGCGVTAPLQSGGAHWLSLYGTRPWDMTEGGPPKALVGSYERNISVSFEPGPNPESKGYLRVPGAFNKAALPKTALIKMMNGCINVRHSYARRHGGSGSSSEEWERRCQKAEQKGIIDPGYPGKEGLQDTGY